MSDRPGSGFRLVRTWQFWRGVSQELIDWPPAAPAAAPFDPAQGGIYDLFEPTGLWSRWAAWPEAIWWPEQLPDDLDRLTAAAQFEAHPPPAPPWALGPDDDQAIQPPAEAPYDPAPAASLYEVEPAAPTKPWAAWPEVEDWPATLPADLDQLASAAQAEIVPNPQRLWTLGPDDDQALQPPAEAPFDPSSIAALLETDTPVGLWPRWLLGETQLGAFFKIFRPDLASAAAETPPEPPAPGQLRWLGPDDDQAVQPPGAPEFDPAPFAPDFEVEPARPLEGWATKPETEDWPPALPEDLDRLAAAAQVELVSRTWPAWALGPDVEEAIQPPAAAPFDPAQAAGLFEPELPRGPWSSWSAWPETVPGASFAEANEAITSIAAETTMLPQAPGLARWLGPDVEQPMEPPFVPPFDPTAHGGVWYETVWYPHNTRRFDFIRQPEPDTTPTWTWLLGIPPGANLVLFDVETGDAFLQLDGPFIIRAS